MTEEARRLLEKAERALNAAETLLRAGDAEFAAGRPTTRCSMLLRLCSVKKACNTASIRGSMPHSASTLPRLDSATPSITAGSWMRLMNG
jgi:hypothetical protein